MRPRVITHVGRFDDRDLACRRAATVFRVGRRWARVVDSHGTGPPVSPS
jgi:hypothetical protein